MLSFPWKYGLVMLKLLALTAYGLQCHVCQYSHATSSDPTTAEQLRDLTNGDAGCVNDDTDRYLQNCAEDSQHCFLIDSTVYVEMTLSHWAIEQSQTMDFTLNNIQRTCLPANATDVIQHGCVQLSEDPEYLSILNQEMEEIATSYRNQGLDADYFTEISGEYCVCQSRGCNLPSHSIGAVTDPVPGPSIPTERRTCLTCNIVKFYSPNSAVDEVLRQNNNGDSGCELGSADAMQCDSDQHACAESIVYVDMTLTDGSIAIPVGYAMAVRGCAYDDDVRVTNGSCIDLGSHAETNALLIGMFEQIARQNELNITNVVITGKMCTCMTDTCNSDVIDENWQDAITIPPPRITTEDISLQCHECFYSKFESQDQIRDSHHSRGLDFGSNICESGELENVGVCTRDKHTCFTDHVEVYGTHTDSGKRWSYTLTERGCSLRKSPLQCNERETIHALEQFAVDNIQVNKEDLFIVGVESEGCLCDANGCNNKPYDAISVYSHAEASNDSGANITQKRVLGIILLIVIVLISL